ncbi:MAG: cytidylyltransferase domain-containing protein [Alkaliphilus sp.]
MRNIAIIPARSGSKGLKDKNIKMLCGKPLMAYTIEAAQKTDLFDEIFVSTDSEEYAKIACECRASTPFLRSEELSSDTASSYDVVCETLKRYGEIGRSFDSFAILQPTSPLRTSGDIVAGYQLMSEKNANAIVGVCEADHSPLWCGTLQNDLSLVGFFKSQKANLPRQMLEQYFRINGALYIVNTSYFLKGKDIYRDRSYAYIMEKKRSVDIDDEFDFKWAEFLLTRI